MYTRTAHTAALDNFRLAEHYLAYRASLGTEGLAGLYRHQNRWLTYSGGIYREIAAQSLEQDLQLYIKRVIDQEQIMARQNTLAQATVRLTKEVLMALGGLIELDSAADLPLWIGPTTPQPVTRIVTKNLQVLVDRRSGRLDIAPLTAQWISTVQIPVEFPTSKEHAACPHWEHFLATTMEGDQDRIDLLQELAGYLLTSDTSLQKFVILEGEGGTGKSTFIRTLTRLLGTDNVSNVPLEQFAERFALAQTVGKLANVCGDMGKVTDRVEGHLKMFTGQDRMQFERKFQTPYFAAPTARLIFATNERPAFTDRTDGIWRRLILIPFNRRVTAEDRRVGIEQALDQELPGILLWALQGLVRLVQRNAFTEPRIARTALEEFKAEANPARAFLLEHYVADPDGVVTIDEVYRHYLEARGTEMHAPLTRSPFGAEVARAFPGLSKTKTRTTEGQRVNAYKGLKAA
ncbi:MAG: phage/plasmid primase, P4 family [Vicinamibacterales bacterium]